MSYRALSYPPHRGYLAEFVGLQVKRKEKYLYIWKCNNITNNTKKRNSRGNNGLLKVTSTLKKYGYQI